MYGSHGKNNFYMFKIVVVVLKMRVNRQTTVQPSVQHCNGGYLSYIVTKIHRTPRVNHSVKYGLCLTVTHPCGSSVVKKVPLWRGCDSGSGYA